MVCIGKEVTEELELEPARFYIKRYFRYKYADGVTIGELPERVIDKGIPGPGLLLTSEEDNQTHYLGKYQKERFLPSGILLGVSQPNQ